MNEIRGIGVLTLGLVWLAVGVGCAYAAEETVVIPLDQIWALDMPGTRNIRKLQAEKLPPPGDGQLVAQIRRSLSKDRPKGEAAKAGFAVLGTGLEALRDAHAVLVEGKEPRKSFPVGSDLTLVFFSQRLSSYYVHVHEVTCQENAISIRYRFVPHETKELTTHFALIPIKGLAEGGYRVRVIQSPMERMFIEAGFKQIDDTYERSIISRPFSFGLRELPNY